MVSNIWRIGQQHLVLGKLYDEVVPNGQTKSAAAKDDDPPTGAGTDSPKGNGAKGNTPKREREADDRRGRHEGPRVEAGGRQSVER